MIVLGIDPGTATTGFGVVEKIGDKMNATNWGLIETDKENKPEERLVDIHERMSELILRYKPDILAIEKVFFANNAKTAIRVGQAQGVILYCAAKYNVEVFEYAPGSIKKVVTGSGRADKKMIQKFIRRVFGAKVRSRVHKKTHFDDAADALAVALCHIRTIDGMNSTGKGGDKSV